MNIEIESNIPIPVTETRQEFPFSEMKVGDSFSTGLLAVRGAIQNFKRTKEGAGFKFLTRKEGSTIRVWRTA